MVAPDARVPVRQRGGTRDNEVSFPEVRDLCLDLTRDRRHNMASQARLLRSYEPKLGDRMHVWIVSLEMSENRAEVVSLTDGTVAMIQVIDPPLPAGPREPS